MSQKSYEVENKYPIDSLETMQSQLEALGAKVLNKSSQCDQYFAHPARDFSSTDEALRIRQIGDQNRITYKGPKLHQETKTRQEIELPLPESEATAQAYHELLEVLGFQAVSKVKKQRIKLELTWEDFRVEAVLDEVEQLGSFIEIEIVSSEESLPQAQSCIQSLAKQLKLPQPERRSYLEMILEK